MTGTKETTEVQDRPLTPEEKEELRVYKAQKERNEKLDKMVEKKEKPRTADDMLEDCYNKLSVLEVDLKNEITQYFYDNGRWEEPEVPAPEETNADGTPKEEEPVTTTSKTSTLSAAKEK